MAASPTAVPTPKTDGGNALAALLAAAAASMHRQQQQQQQNQQQQQTHANLDNTDVQRRNKNNSGGIKRTSAARLVANISDEQQKGPNQTKSHQTIQQQLESNRDTLCQLLNLKPATLIDSSLSANCSLTNLPPSTTNNNNNQFNKRSTSTSPSSVRHLLSSKSKMEMLQQQQQQHQQNNHNHQQFPIQNGFDKLERSPTKYDYGQQQCSARKQNGESKLQSNNNNNSCYHKDSVSSQHKRQATSRTVNTAATVTGTITTKTRSKTNHKSSTSSSSSISTDKDSTNAAKLLVSLINGNATTKPVIVNEVNKDELRNLESWHDEDEVPLDDSSYQELVDSNNSNGWSADEMFKYNEKMHKITSSYNEKTLAGKYTTALPKTNSKATMRLATQLAREIEERVLAEGRITPESSDDDELFETERMQRVKLKQQKQLDNLKNPQRMSMNRCSNNQAHLINNTATSKTTTNTTKSSSQYSNSTETPATASLSSSPTLNDTVKPVTSSSRNILRTCLT